LKAQTLAPIMELLSEEKFELPGLAKETITIA
jgi:hypothetical protein